MNDQASTFQEFRFEHSPMFLEILQHCRCSLLVSTYQAGKLAVIGAHQGKLEVSLHHFDQAMGVALHHRGLAVASKSQIWFLQSVPAMASQIQPAGKYDACYLARQSHLTGEIHLHEIAWGKQHLWMVNTLFSTLATIHEDYSYVPRWRPKFISELAAEDRCHLNGVAMIDGEPRFVTAMGETNSAAGWRAEKSNGGVVIDIHTDRVVARGLAMPHSPRYYENQLWVLDSGRGSLSRVSSSSDKAEEIVQLPGYTRGLAFSGQFAFVGLSKIRESAVFSGLPIQEAFPDLNCGIGIVDLVSGKNVAAFQFKTGVDEIFDVQVLPQSLLPAIVGPQDDAEKSTHQWLVPPPEFVPQLDQKISRSVFTLPESDRSLPVEFAQQDPAALLRRGLELHLKGELKEAVKSFQAAIAIRADFADAYINLGNVYQELNDTKLAVDCYHQAIRIDPNSVNALRNLGYVLKEQGETSEGEQHLHRAQKLEFNPTIEFVLATSLPPVYASKQHMHHCREKLEHNLETLTKTGFKLDVTRQAASTNFYSAYQGLNDRHLQKQIAQLLVAPQPQLKKQQPSQGRRRIGLISRYFRNHTIGRLNLGTVQNLPRDLFEVFVISVGTHHDQLAQEFSAAADQFVSLPTRLEKIREAVVALDLDVLLFTDVGMDTLTYSLSMSRLAPVQCVTWGHPVTTGSPVMDYFISSDTAEGFDSEQHYSEQLKKFRVLNVFYHRPSEPAARDHAYFKLDPTRNVYLCFQSLFKFHPDFDEILVGILKKDPQGDIVLMEGRYPAWTQALQDRLRPQLGTDLARVKFLPPQSHADFLSLHRLADVSLDPLHFGGGNTTYEALSIGLPVVTLPSEFLRCRLTYAMYQQMGINDLVVNSPKEFVELAVRLGTNKTCRQQMSEKILDHASLLFSDTRAIEDYTAFFSTVNNG